MSVLALANIIALSLAAGLALSGLLHLIAPRALIEAYRAWEFGRGFHYVAGAAQLLAALFLVVPQTRVWGGALAASVLFIAIVSLLNRRQYSYAIPAMLVMLLLAPAMAGAI